MEWSELVEMLDAADMVLVGVGEDFEEKEALLQKAGYAEACNSIATAGVEWVMPYVNRFFLEGDIRLQTALQALSVLLHNRNYFVISACMNGMTAEAGLLPDRLVEPCGSYAMLQCSKGCSGSIRPVEKELLQEIEQCVRGERGWQTLKTPVCEKCKAPMLFNSLYTEHYNEEGYRKNWERYTKWLQGTVGKKLCILELGAGLMFAGVLRFRFERITALNQKAGLIRVHESLNRLPDGIAGRSKSISQNAVDFMAEMIVL